MRKYIQLGCEFALLACLLFAFSGQVSATTLTADTDDFVITVKTDNTGSSADTEFTIPTHVDETYNYNVDCNNDGTDEVTGATGDYTCDYGATGLNLGAGTYTIRIKDNVGDGTGFPRIYFNITGDNQKITSIEQWGTGKWTSFGSAFYGCYYMYGNATDLPDISNVTDMSKMFAYAHRFNQDISGLDVSNITNMSSMLENAASFNQDISGWNTGSVTNMSRMFATTFNFNQDITGWNTSNVTDMSGMFSNHSNFNQDISGWDVSKVTTMEGMFLAATKFDQDLSTWNTGSVTTMENMFYGATSFDQDISDWDVSSLQNAFQMFKGTRLSTDNYDALLIGWNAQTLQTDVSFSAGNSYYCHGEAAHDNLELHSALGGHSWYLTDAGLNCSQYAAPTLLAPSDSANIYTTKPVLDWEDVDFATSYTLQYSADAEFTSPTEEVVSESSFMVSSGLAKGEWFWRVKASGTAPESEWSAVSSFEIVDLPASDYVITVKTDNVGVSGDTEFTIPTGGTGYNYNVDCDGDGIDDATAQSGDYTCSYSTAGEYLVLISDNKGDDTGFPGIVFNNGGDKDKLLTIEQWGTGHWMYMNNAYRGCTNLDVVATDTPELYWVVQMESMFQGAINLVGNSSMGDWNTATVWNLEKMFQNTPKFNQDIGSWDVSNVQIFTAMFNGATTFDQDLSGWDVSMGASMSNMFSGVTLSTRNYDAMLIAWDKYNLVNSISFDGGNSTYCMGETARTSIINQDYWSFTDGGKDCSAYDFIITVQTDNTGSSADDQFTIPYDAGSAYNYNVDCNNDGTDEATGVTADYTCDYGAAGLNTGPGTYTIRIADNVGDFTGFPRIHFNNTGDKEKLLSVDQWGGMKWTSMNGAFYGCSNLQINASDAPNLSGVTDLGFMFAGASSMNADISGWGTGNVTAMHVMFWDATSFNQDISGWNTSSVTNMRSMFHGAAAFDQDISTWNTGSVTDMNNMFNGATAFDQDLSAWDVSSAVNMTDMFNGITLSQTNYDAILIGWDAQTLQSGVVFDGGNSTYCAGADARANMVSSDGWTITDGGRYCSSADADHFVITVKTDNSGTSGDTEFTIPEQDATAYNYNVDCDNDGVDEAYEVTGAYTCSYDTAGTYTIRIKDNIGDGTGFQRIFFNNEGDKDKLLSVDQWGSAKWNSMRGAFWGCSNLDGTASDNPDLSLVTTMRSMFQGATSFNGDISGWTTSSVATTYHMFDGASAFNQDIGGWDVSDVETMNSMFLNATSFNQDLSSWETGSVGVMDEMFSGATAFDQNIGAWDVTSLTTATNMFNGVTLSTANYDSLLSGWNAQILNSGVTFSGGSSTYCTAETDRENMVDLVTNGGDEWTITDGGKDCGPDPYWLHEFGYGEGWENPETPRTAADVDGDGINDLIGFAPEGVRIALGTGSAFEDSTLWLPAFGSNAEAGGWGGENSIRTAADVNGDGKADIVGFGNFGVVVSLSTGTSFTAPEYWTYVYGSDASAGGWSSTENNRVVADVNGDGMADVVGYADYGVLVSLSTGTSFQTEEYWVMGYGRLWGGWDGIQNPRMIADVDGDGCGDVVGFGNYGVVVSLSNACGTTPTNSFSDAAYWTLGYGYLLGDWDATQHIRTFADVDGDGDADLVGFGNYGVLVSLSDGSSAFGGCAYWMMGYGYIMGGWDVNQHPRSLADVNGDGLADVVGYATDGVLVSLSDGTKFE